MTNDNGIVESNKNPFACDSWINQKYSFTPKRQQQMLGLIGIDYTIILDTKNKNKSTYVAFVAIRWGFAVILNGILTPTEKWENRDLYNGFGHLKKD